MVKIVKSSRLNSGFLDREQKLWAYNGLDCCNTKEVADAMRPIIAADPYFKHVYEMEMAFYAPAMSIQLDGIKIDEAERQLKIREISEELYILSGRKKDDKGKWFLHNKAALFPAIVGALTGEPFAHTQVSKVAAAIYDGLQIDKVYDPAKKTRTPTTGDDALSEIAKKYMHARPLITLLLYIRGRYKELEVLERGVDPDGRMRFGISVAGTETGRWSSKKNIFDRGGNGQNIAKPLRSIFIPDEGYTIGYCDLKSAESYAVGYSSGDANYIETFKKEDVHTLVASIAFKIKKDRKWAEKNEFKPGMSYRDGAKRAGHGTNYLLTHRSLARHMRIKERQAFYFQCAYYGGECSLEKAIQWEMLDLEHTIEPGSEIVKFKGLFPGIRGWHHMIQQQLVNDGYIITAMGRKRKFDGDPLDRKTLREAVAYEPQSTIVDILNIGLWRVWYHLGKEGLKLLHQVHDAIVVQVPKGTEEYFGRRIKELMVFPVKIKGREMSIPIDINWGTNWKEVS